MSEAARIADAPCQITGTGSLLMMHLHQRPVVDYRSAYRRPEEKALHDQLYRYLINHGILTSQLGLGAVSTPMTEADIDRLAETVLGALRAINWRPKGTAA